MNTLILSFAIFVIIFIAVTEFFHNKLGAVTMPTLSWVRKGMIRQITPKAGQTVMELGSGWGGIAIAAAKQWPECQVIGIEYSVFPFWVSRMRCLLNPSLKNLTFRRENIFEISYSSTSLVLCYLGNQHMAKLREKFVTELPDGAYIVSNTFFIPDWEIEKEDVVKGIIWPTKIFTYQKKSA